MAFRGGGFSGKKGGKSAGFGVAMGAMSNFSATHRRPPAAPSARNFNSAIKPFAAPPITHSAPHYSNPNSGMRLNKSLFSNAGSSSFGNAMGNAIGGALGSAIVMAVGSKIQERQQEYADKKAAEALAAQQAAEAAEQAKREAAFHAMNKNMPNYDEETAVHLMNGNGLTEEEKANYPLQCPHCLGVPDGTRYCPYCGGKLV